MGERVGGDGGGHERVLRLRHRRALCAFAVAVAMFCIPSALLFLTGDPGGLALLLVGGGLSAVCVLGALGVPTALVTSSKSLVVKHVWGRRVIPLDLISGFDVRRLPNRDGGRRRDHAKHKWLFIYTTDQRYYGIPASLLREPVQQVSSEIRDWLAEFSAAVPRPAGERRLARFRNVASVFGTTVVIGAILYCTPVVVRHGSTGEGIGMFALVVLIAFMWVRVNPLALVGADDALLFKHLVGARRVPRTDIASVESSAVWPPAALAIDERARRCALCVRMRSGKALSFSAYVLGRPPRDVAAKLNEWLANARSGATESTA